MTIKNLTRICLMSLAVTVTSGVITSCGGDAQKANIYRLDREISYGEMPTDSSAIRATERLFEMSGYPHATALTVGDYAQKASIREHLPEVERVFADTDRESEALGRIFASMREQLPKAVIPQVYTIISPFSQSVLVSDSMLFVGLNHYLGTDYEAYGYFPDYVRRLKVRGRLPLDVAEAIVRTSYPFRPATEYPQAVQRMAYEGAVAVAVERVTGRQPREVLGYDEEEYRLLGEKEEQMWRTLAERQLLFSTDGAVIRSLVDVAPSTSVLSPDAPGRAGRYVGRQLVGAYMDKNGGTSIEQLLSPDFYNDPALLTKAAYHP